MASVGPALKGLAVAVCGVRVGSEPRGLAGRQGDAGVATVVERDDLCRVVDGMAGRCWRVPVMAQQEPSHGDRYDDEDEERGYPACGSRLDMPRVGGGAKAQWCRYRVMPNAGTMGAWPSR